MHDLQSTPRSQSSSFVLKIAVFPGAGACIGIVNALLDRNERMQLKLLSWSQRFRRVIYYFAILVQTYLLSGVE